MKIHRSYVNVTPHKMEGQRISKGRCGVRDLSLKQITPEPFTPAALPIEPIIQSSLPTVMYVKSSVTGNLSIHLWRNSLSLQK